MPDLALLRDILTGCRLADVIWSGGSFLGVVVSVGARTGFEHYEKKRYAPLI